MPDAPPEPADPFAPLPQSELPHGRAIASLWLGLLGMVTYLVALQWGIRDASKAHYREQADLPASQVPPLLASLGCVLFIVAVVLSWRVRLSRLLMLAFCSGLLVWAVVWAQEVYRW